MPECAKRTKKRNAYIWEGYVQEEKNWSQDPPKLHYTHTRARAHTHTQAFVKAFLPCFESPFLEIYITESWRWCACASLAIYRSYIYKCTQTFRQLNTLPSKASLPRIQRERERRERETRDTHAHTHGNRHALAFPTRDMHADSYN